MSMSKKLDNNMRDLTNVIERRCRCFCVEMVKPFPCIDIVLMIFRSLVIQEYWVLTESRTPLKPVLWGMRIVALSTIVLINRLNKTETVVFSYCRFTLFTRDPFFQIIQVLFQ